MAEDPDRSEKEIIVGGGIQDPITRTLLERAVSAMDGLNVPWSVGGGIAVGVHGVVRATYDVDLFAADDCRQAVLRAFRAAGFVVDKVFGRFHYIAFLPGLSADPRHRVDLLFPAGEPEISAVEYPKTARVGAVVFPVFPVELLVLSKFYSEEETDRWDIAALYIRGAFEPDTVRALLAQSDPASLEAWDSLVADLQRPSARRDPPRRERYKLEK